VGRPEEDGTTRLDQSFPQRLQNLAMQSQRDVKGPLIAHFYKSDHSGGIQRTESALSLPSIFLPGFEEPDSFHFQDKTIRKIGIYLARAPERSAVQLHPAATRMIKPEECSWLQPDHPTALSPRCRPPSPTRFWPHNGHGALETHVRVPTSCSTCKFMYYLLLHILCG